MAFLACASIGAIWSSCSPDFGARSVVDRFAPDRAEGAARRSTATATTGATSTARDVVAELQPSSTLERTVWCRLSATPNGAGWRRDAGFLASTAPLEFAARALRPPAVDPLLVRHHRAAQGDRAGPGRHPARAPQEAAPAHRPRPGDRFFWFTTTGWMMWNFLVGGLLVGAAVVLYDGSPGRTRTWARCGTSPRAPASRASAPAPATSRRCMKAGVEPGEGRDLSSAARVGSTGSPLPPEGFRWVYEHVGRDAWLFSTSGGTDLCTAFVGGCPLLPVYAGELQCARARRDGRGLRPGRPAADRPGRRAGDHRADALDAAVPVERPRTASATARATSTPTRASGATATGSRSPSAAARSSTGARTRPSTAAACAWAPPRSTAR